MHRGGAACASAAARWGRDARTGGRRTIYTTRRRVPRTRGPSNARGISGTRGQATPDGPRGGPMLVRRCGVLGCCRGRLFGVRVPRDGAVR
jgi:hypothetical protein